MEADWQDESLPWRERYRSFLKSLEWKRIREEAARVLGKKCAYCGTTERIQYHHKTYDRWSDPEMDDLMPLCFEHHRQVERKLKGVKLPNDEMEREIFRVLELNEREEGMSKEPCN